MSYTFELTLVDGSVYNIEVLEQDKQDTIRDMTEGKGLLMAETDDTIVYIPARNVLHFTII